MSLILFSSLQALHMRPALPLVFTHLVLTDLAWFGFVSSYKHEGQDDASHKLEAAMALYNADQERLKGSQTQETLDVR